MRNRNAQRKCLNRPARGGRLLFLAIGLFLSMPMVGCGPGEAEMFISDVKNFYLSGLLTGSGATDDEATAEEGGDELTAVDELAAEDARDVEVDLARSPGHAPEPGPGHTGSGRADVAGQRVPGRTR